MLHETANYDQLIRGLAFPTFYQKLYPDLREEMTRAVAAARPAEGLWRVDETQSRAKITSLATIADTCVVLPKLYRRLVDYLVLNGQDPSLAGFLQYLAQRDDRLFIIPTAHWTGFDSVVDVQGQTVRLTRLPEDLLFQEV
jgi:hypothetical protein